MRTIDRWLSGFKHLQKKLMINIFLSLVIMMVVRFSILMPFVNESLFSQHSPNSSPKCDTLQFKRLASFLQKPWLAA